jgi:hypothetical protein
MTRYLAAGILLSITCLFGCGGTDGQADNTDQQEFSDYTTARQTATENDEFFVTYEPTPAPIPLEELFELSVRVYQSSDMNSLVDTSDLSVEAEMPTHGHGMNTGPEITVEQPGVFTIRGMKFHMPSDPGNPWVIRLTPQIDGSSDTAKFKVITSQTR